MMNRRRTGKDMRKNRNRNHDGTQILFRNREDSWDFTEKVVVIDDRNEKNIQYHIFDSIEDDILQESLIHTCYYLTQNTFIFNIHDISKEDLNVFRTYLQNHVELKEIVKVNSDT